jgi:hypothetical protein
MPDDNYTKEIFRWQRQVLADGRLSPLAIRVVMGLCIYINRKSRDAWPSQGTLAKMVHASRRGVQKVLDQLSDCGHLNISVNRGRGRSNRYRPIIHPVDGSRAWENANGSAHFMDQKCELPFATVRTGVRTGVRTRVRMNYLNGEPSETLRPTPELEMEFEIWYRAYPKHQAKREALIAYVNARSRGATAETLLLAAERYSYARAGKDPQYTRSPANWLNGDCWLDEPEIQLADIPTAPSRNAEGLSMPERMAAAAKRARAQ